MLRVGLTGGLGSGKSTVAAMLAARGAHVLSADEIGRALMQPGQEVFDAIVRTFGPEVLTPAGTLDRPVLARLAFSEGRLEELNAIVHPATIAEQARRMREIFAGDPGAIVVVESALIFETKYGAAMDGSGWRDRFDALVLVTAPEELKIARFVARSAAGGQTREALEAEARRRLAQMISDEEKGPRCDFILPNDGTLEELQIRVDQLWQQMQQMSAAAKHRRSG